MTPDDLTKPAVPIAYGLLTLQLAEERGVTRDAMLEGLDLPEGILAKADARLSMEQYSRMIYRSLVLTNDPAIGYEFGLRCGLTTHGFLGLGALSQATVGDAIDFGIQFVRLRTPIYSVRSFVDGEQAVIDVAEAVPFGPLRRYAFEIFLVTWSRLARDLAARDDIPIEMWFDHPEPEHHARYRDRLPPARFESTANQLRFPAALLDAPLATANPTTATLVREQSRRELDALGHTEDFLARVRAVLVDGDGGYRDLEGVAAKLYVSARTLKRKLRAHGVSFREILDDARRRDAVRLLGDPTLTVLMVADRVGYMSPGNFTRAFRRWTGTTPEAYRAERLSIAPRRGSRRP